MTMTIEDDTAPDASPAPRPTARLWLVSGLGFLGALLLLVCCGSEPSPSPAPDDAATLAPADMGQPAPDLLPLAPACNWPCDQHDRMACGGVPSLCDCPGGVYCCCVGWRR